MRTTVATPDELRRPLYVTQLEATVRRLDALVEEEGVTIRADHPEDCGIEPWMAELVESLREQGGAS